MAENAPAPETDNNPNEIRSTLIKRLAVAGVLVASLLGMLAFFDYLATAPEEPEAPVFTRPVPVVPKKEVSQPVTPATDLPEPPTSSTPEPVIEAPPAPVVEAQPPAIIDVKPEIRPDIRPDIRPPAASTAGATKAPVAASPAPARQPRVVP
jgi:DedD protein